jgi:hypothetical protein
VSEVVALDPRAVYQGREGGGDGNARGADGASAAGTRGGRQGDGKGAVGGDGGGGGAGDSRGDGEGGGGSGGGFALRFDALEVLFKVLKSGGSSEATIATVRPWHGAATAPRPTPE